MASEFRVFTIRNCDTVHLELMGDFDGTSAFQVLDSPQKKCLGRPPGRHSYQSPGVYQSIWDKCLSAEPFRNEPPFPPTLLYG